MGETFDRELRQRLTAAGCQFLRVGKGSHEIWYSPVSDRHFTVPARVTNRHTANGVLKDARLAKAF